MAKSTISAKQTKVRQHIPLAPYLFLIPWFFGIAIFRIYPLFRSGWESVHNFNPILRAQGHPNAGQFVGFQHYIHLFTTDTVFWDSVRATLQYVLIGTPAVLVTALFIAYVLNFNLKGVNFFRTAYYVPSILGGNVAVSILWRQMFAPNGLINAILGALGVEPILWLIDPTFTPFTLIFLSAWQFGSVMLIFLAALQNVSPSLYEAASIDGARKFRQFISITIPIITPMILFNTVNVLLRHFQEFNAAFLIPDSPGGPLNATRFLNLYIYQIAFTGTPDFGLASALTWILLLVIGSLSAIIFFSSKHWVHYND